MAGGKGRAPNEWKQALPPPEHMILRPYGLLASDGLVLGAETCKKSQSQEKLEVLLPSFVRHGHVCPSGSEDHVAKRGEHLAGFKQQLRAKKSAVGTCPPHWGVPLLWVNPRLL